MKPVYYINYFLNVCILSSHSHSHSIFFSFCKQRACAHSEVSFENSMGVLFRYHAMSIWIQCALCIVLNCAQIHIRANNLKFMKRMHILWYFLANLISLYSLHSVQRWNFMFDLFHLVFMQRSHDYNENNEWKRTVFILNWRRFTVVVFAWSVPTKRKKWLLSCTTLCNFHSRRIYKYLLGYLAEGAQTLQNKIQWV